MKKFEIVLETNTTKTVVPRMGFGCMSLVAVSYQPRAGEQVDDPREVLKEAHRLNMRLWDTADMYAEGRSEELLGTMWGDVPRGEIILASKCGIVRDPENPRASNVNNTADYVVTACAESLRRLDTDYLDIYYLHRKDPDVAIEEPMKGFKQLVEEGKTRHIGLCEVDSETLRKAHAVHPVSAVQIEFSLLTRGPASELLETCRELGVKVVAYSPISRGLLTGAVSNSTEIFSEKDARRSMPRFSEENLAKNIVIVDRIRAIADSKGCSLPQLCLAYVLHQSDDVIPIPGTKSISHLQSNAAALNVELSAEDIASLEAAAPIGVTSGARYSERDMEKFQLK